MGSEEVHKQGIELVSVARAWLRRSGACYAATALGPPATTGAMPAARWYPRGREDERLLGRTATRVRASDEPVSVQ